jgi:ubiquinone/menaquinone biosynthesis C-methylase UbiE
MKREHTNIVRFIIEDCIPPIVRDTRLFNAILSKASGMNLKKCRKLRQDTPQLTPEKIAAFYADYPRIQDGTDNSQRCVREIIANITGRSLCDIGCGTGYLLERIKHECSLERLAGVDFSKHDEWERLNGIEFYDHDIMELPFDDDQFDTVVCTHTLEHLLDIRAAVSELRRICASKLIIVVPRERESIWSVNPHFYYFPYEHSFLKHMLPIPEKWSIKRIQRDYIYTEDSLANETSHDETHR